MFYCYKTLFIERDLLYNTGYSIFINLGGYLQALAIAVPLGFFVGFIPFFRHLVSKQIEAIRFTPCLQQQEFLWHFSGLG